MKYMKATESLHPSIRDFDEDFYSSGVLYWLDRNATFHLTYSNIKVKIMMSSSRILVKHYVKKTVVITLLPSANEVAER